jgi:CHAD domain-containing protein
MDIFPKDVLSKAEQTVPAEEVEDDSPVDDVVEVLTIEELCRRHHVDMDHAAQVGGFTRELFDLTRPLHQLDTAYREVAYHAGFLHNVALSGGIRRHHTRGRDILLSTGIREMDDEDRAVIAVTTAFHRKRWRQDRLESETSYTALSPELQEVARWLSAMVRIADGLDYSQSQTSTIGPAKVGPDGVHLTVDGPFVDIDAPRADQKADMWRAVTGIPLRVTSIDESPDDLEQETELPPSIEPEAPQIQPDDSMYDAGRKVLLFHLQNMLYHEPGVIAGEDIEALHKMRVATRRLRVALDVFGPYFEPKRRKGVAADLKRFGRALGRVRDLDVLIHHAQSVLAASPPEERNRLDSLFDHLGKRRDKARVKVLAYLDGQTYLDLIDKIMDLCEATGPDGDESDTATPSSVQVAHAAPAIIYKHYEVVRTYETLLDQPAMATLHALRMNTKRLRYILEFFREVLGAEAAVVLDSLVRLQDHLGALNDADVARRSLWQYLEKRVAKARKQQKDRPPGEALPDIEGVTAYVGLRERELHQLHDSLPAVWQEIVSPDTRRNLALAIGVL